MATSLMRSLIIAALAALAAPALADDETAPGSPPSDKPAAKPYPSGITCAWIPDPFGYGVIDEKHMVLDGSASRKYLVTFHTRCYGLRYAFGIGLERHSSQLCSGDSVVAGHDRCTIRYIEQVKDAREANAIVEARLAAEEDARKKKSGN